MNSFKTVLTTAALMGLNAPVIAAYHPTGTTVSYSVPVSTSTYSQTRYYNVYVPSSYQKGTAAPMVISDGPNNNPPTDPDSVISCNVYTKTASNRSDIYNCVATWTGHAEPSYAVPMGSVNESIVGNQNRDIDAASKEWEFFSAHPRP